MFRAKVIEKNIIVILYPLQFFRKSYGFRDKQNKRNRILEHTASAKRRFTSVT
jgi:hypothetical protein